MKLYAPSTIKEIKEQYGFKTAKSLGQNFLTDKGIIDKIIEGSEIGSGDLIIEIGPGMGVLTWEAARLAKKVIAVEIDRNLIPILEKNLSEYENVEILNQDILKTDLNAIIQREKEKGFSGVKIIGNLPYYITTPILMKLLEEHVDAESITVMMQKEVADRLRSAPGRKTYGAISVAVQYYCETEEIVRAPREAFLPRPNVDSSVLRLKIRKEKPVELLDQEIFFSCVKAGFGQRRKTLLNALTGAEGMTKEEVFQVLQASAIDGNRRAETLNLEEFARLANEAKKRLQGQKGI